MTTMWNQADFLVKANVHTTCSHDETTSAELICSVLVGVGFEPPTATRRCEASEISRTS
jgi:hypothetical protein